MINNARMDAILEIARSEGHVTVEELATKFDVAPQTVRRDLTRLTESGQLERRRGGAVPVSGMTNIDYRERKKLNAASKACIGRDCAAKIPNNSTIFLNSGTTVEAVARELLGHTNLLVVTNSLNSANILSANPNIEIVVTGGSLRRADGGLLGNLTTQVVDLFKFDYSVISCAGIDSDGELLDFDMQEVYATQAIIRRTRATFVVLDRSKILRSAPGRVGTIAEVDTLFTDADLPDDLQDDWGQFDVKLHFVDHPEPEK